MIEKMLTRMSNDLTTRILVTGAVVLFPTAIAINWLSAVFQGLLWDADFLTENEFRELEKNNLIAALKSADWRVSGVGGAAELLGIKPSTFSYRMKAFGISSRNPAAP